MPMQESHEFKCALGVTVHIHLFLSTLRVSVDPSSRNEVRSIFAPEHGGAIDRPRNNVDIGTFRDLVIKELSLSDSLAGCDRDDGVEPQNFIGDGTEEREVVDYALVQCSMGRRGRKSRTDLVAQLVLDLGMLSKEIDAP